MHAADFVHHRASGEPPTLLLLHGTGADEHDLVPLAEAVAPGWAVLSPRGRVLEAGMPRWFRRITAHEYDIEDIRVRAAELAGWLREQGDRPLVALGFSNGANMAAALLLLHPEVLSGAVLLRANLPVTPDRPPPPDSYRGVPVLIANARRDPYRREGDTEGLAQVLESAGADVEIRWSPGGHELGPGEIDIVRDWLARWRTRWTSATVTR